MNLKSSIRSEVSAALRELYQLSVPDDELVLTATKKEFEGDFTLVMFPVLKQLKLNPNELAQALASWFGKHSQWIKHAEAKGGFLNLSLGVAAWPFAMQHALHPEAFIIPEQHGDTVLIEFSSPNTNKPLHLGHIRNILLGWSMSNILELTGCDVKRVQIINDRGIAICKSMVAWLKYADGETPESSGIAGDQLVGKYYVMFDIEAKKQADALPEGEDTPLMKEAREMLLRWEAGDPETRELWARMNGWVYDGHNVTYNRLGVWFDKLYYESDTYLLGKEVIKKGLSSGVFFQKDDGSVWIDLSDAGLDHKLVLRSDGTSVYITQDIGTAMLRYDDFGARRMVYVVANEQDYHFQVLFEIVRRMGEPFADGLYHLSYAMVDLPSGRMKTREGTVVDADDLMDDMVATAAQTGEERGLLADLEESERREIYRKIGMAALKYYILRVHPRKRIIFNPEESLDMQGQTGPYIQNAYVRISSIARKAGIEVVTDLSAIVTEPEKPEKEIMVLLTEYPEVVKSAARQYNPSDVTNYAYALAKAFHRYYHDYPILHHPDASIRQFRLYLCHAVARVLEHSMNLLGIELPERM